MESQLKECCWKWEPEGEWEGHDGQESIKDHKWLVTLGCWLQGANCVAAYWVWHSQIATRHKEIPNTKLCTLLMLGCWMCATICDCTPAQAFFGCSLFLSVLVYLVLSIAWKLSQPSKVFQSWHILAARCLASFTSPIRGSQRFPTGFFTSTKRSCTCSAFKWLYKKGLVTGTRGCVVCHF